MHVSHQFPKKFGALHSVIGLMSTAAKFFLPNSKFAIFGEKKCSVKYARLNIAKTIPHAIFHDDEEK